MPWITSTEGRAARELAGRLLIAFPTDPLVAGTALRRELPGLAPQDAAMAIVQAQLGLLAQERYGIDADGLLLTRDGLEQATRPEVAARRAALLQAQGVHSVTDMCAGLGFDVRAFLASGLKVTAVERDELTSEYLRVNAPGAVVIQGDATADESLLDTLAPDTVLFLDPARRSGQRTMDGTRAQSERDPERWSPPWSFVTSLATRGFRVCVKVAPGFDPALMPEGWSGIWTSMHREAVEAMLCSWSLDAPRTAVAIGAQTYSFAGDGSAEPSIAQVRAWLHEPDTCLVQARLLNDFCADNPALARVDDERSWLTSDAEVQHPLLRSYRVIAQLPNDTRALRRELQARQIGELTIKCRGMKINAEAMRRELRLQPGSAATIVITRAGGARSTLLVHEDR